MATRLNVAVDDVHVSNRAADLTLRRSVHGTAEIAFKVAARPGDHWPAYAQVVVTDSATADVVAEGRLEDPGYTVSADGATFEMSAIGEYARTADRTAGLVYVDADLSRWMREQLERATSAGGQASDLPSNTGIDCLLLQYNPGQAIDSTSSIVMGYRAMAEAGMEIGGVQYTVVNGQDNVSYENRLHAAGSGLLKQDTWSSTPARLGSVLGGTLPTGVIAVTLSAPRTGSATNLTIDTAWAGFYDIQVKAARFYADGTPNTANADYQDGRGVYAHEVVADLLGRGLLPTYDGATAAIDTTSTHQIDQLAYPDGVSPEKLLEDLSALEPDFFAVIGPSDPATGLASFTWRRWDTHARYEASLRDGISLPGADVERFNRVTVRWLDSRKRPRTTVYTADGVFAPVVPELETVGSDGTRLLREPSEPIDLADEIGSQANADKAAAEFLAEHAVPPVSGTLTVGHRVYDADQGCHVDPADVEAGFLVRVPERVVDVDDLDEDGRDGRCLFRIVGTTYSRSEGAATLELDAPPRSDENELAVQIGRRDRKR